MPCLCLCLEERRRRVKDLDMMVLYNVIGITGVVGDDTSVSVSHGWLVRSSHVGCLASR